MVVCGIRPDKDDPNHARITIGGNRICYPGNVGTNTDSWNFSSSSLTVYSFEKVSFLAQSTLRTSTLTLPCPSLNTFASKSWASPTSSSTNTSLQVWTKMDEFTLKSARVTTACPKQAS